MTQYVGLDVSMKETSAQAGRRGAMHRSGNFIASLAAAASQWSTHFHSRMLGTPWHMLLDLLTTPRVVEEWRR